MIRQGTLGIVDAWVQTLKYRAKRSSELDPWEQRDQWRLNHRPLREIKFRLDDIKTKNIFIEYLDENTFNAYHKDEHGFLTPILMKGHIKLHPTIPDRLLVSTEADSYHVDFFLDREGNITQLDYEGHPLNTVSYNSLLTFLETTTCRLDQRIRHCRRWC